MAKYSAPILIVSLVVVLIGMMAGAPDRPAGVESANAPAVAAVAAGRFPHLAIPSARRRATRVDRATHFADDTPPTTPASLENVTAVAGDDARVLGSVATSPPPVPFERTDRLTLVITCALDELAFSVTLALQACIDAAPPESAVEIPRGVYRLDQQVVITKPLTLRTKGGAAGDVKCQTGPDGCARLTASPGLLDDYGVLLVQKTRNVTLEHIVVDGNRRARLTAPAGAACRAGRNTAGFNATVSHCVDCALRDFVSVNALCGTGMLWDGARAVIERSDFRDNGQAGTPGLWADGLTAVYAPESTIVNNRFIDNSDVGLIVGYAVGSRIEDNDVIQREQDLFAGIMLDNFTSDDLKHAGDFRGAIVTDNIVDCRPQWCLFGIQVGPRPWFAGVNVVGGTIFDNQVHGARVGINVDGAGTLDAPVRIFSNRVTDVPPGSFANCRNDISTSWMNIAPTSVVDRGDDQTPTDAHLTDGCQFFSAVVPSAHKAGN